MTQAKSTGEAAPSKGPAPMQVLVRGLRILSEFTADQPAMSLAELGRRTGLHRATVYRFVKTLQTEGYLSLDAATGLYRIGPAWATALYSMGGNSILSEIFEHDLQELADTTGESASLSVRKGDTIQMVNVVATRGSFAPVPPESPFLPLSEHAMVHARIHLAHASEDTKRRMLAVPAVRYTENTVTDRAAIKTRLDRTKAEGIAYSRSEYRYGAAAIAVPVVSQGNMVAGVGLVIPAERYDSDLQSYERQLRDAAAVMGRRLDEGLGQSQE